MVQLPAARRASSAGGGGGGGGGSVGLDHLFRDYLRERAPGFVRMGRRSQPRHRQRLHERSLDEDPADYLEILDEDPADYLEILDEDPADYLGDVPGPLVATKPIDNGAAQSLAIAAASFGVVYCASMALAEYVGETPGALGAAGAVSLIALAIKWHPAPVILGSGAAAIVTIYRRTAASGFRPRRASRRGRRK